mmetsp:Transcript_30792/g.35921  ORF Transcript_30792/g.35921 Transcript_30792/m.35921 type:complete len:759 (-) Transcript_30792:1048-3324(-)
MLPKRPIHGLLLNHVNAPKLMSTRITSSYEQLYFLKKQKLHQSSFQNTGIVLHEQPSNRKSITSFKNHRLRDLTHSYTVSNTVTSLSNNNSIDQLQRRYYGSISDRIWDVLQSGSLNPSNPIIEDIANSTSSMNHVIDFSRYKPHHIVSASIELQAQYEEEFTQLEKDIQQGNENNVEYHDLIFKLENIARPIVTLKNYIILLLCVNNNASYSKALNESICRLQLRHEKSKHLYKALKTIENNFLRDHEIGSSAQQRLRVVQLLLQKFRVNGISLDNISQHEDTLEEIQSRLMTLEDKFLELSSYTMEEHGKVTSTQKLIPFLYEILALKQHRSKLLGYDNYASYSFDNHSAMTQDIKEIHSLHQVFTEKAVEKFGSDDFLIEHSEIMNDKSISELSQYFEFNNVLNNLFELSSNLFGIKIVEERDQSKIPGWGHDVRLFHLFDEQGYQEDEGKEKNKLVGSFFIDPFRRLSKDSGEFMVPIIHGRKKVSDCDSSQNHHDVTPIVAIALNLRTPTWDDSPVLLQFNDVISIFHEFGHCLQHIMTNVELGLFSGAHCIEEDASELVSQFMEYWLIKGPLLHKMSKHYKTGEKLPSDIIKRLQKKHQSIKCNELLHRLFLGELETQLNASFDPNGEESIIAFQNKYANLFCPTHQIPPKGYIDPLIQLFQSNADGKCTMQYRYLFSDVMSADAYSAFEDKMMNVDENHDCNFNSELKEIGLKFRKSFLEAGGSMSTKDAFVLFRGGHTNTDALLKFYGLN